MDSMHAEDDWPQRPLQNFRFPKSLAQSLGQSLGKSRSGTYTGRRFPIQNFFRDGHVNFAQNVRFSFLQGFFSMPPIGAARPCAGSDLFDDFNDGNTCASVLPLASMSLHTSSHLPRRGKHHVPSECRSLCVKFQQRKGSVLCNHSTCTWVRAHLRCDPDRQMHFI